MGKTCHSPPPFNHYPGTRMFHTNPLMMGIKKSSEVPFQVIGQRRSTLANKNSKGRTGRFGYPVFLYTLPKTDSLPLKMDGWESGNYLHFGKAYFQGWTVGFREGTSNNIANNRFHVVLLFKKIFPGNLCKRPSRPLFQENYNTPVEHTPGNPPTIPMKGIPL